MEHDRALCGHSVQALVLNARSHTVLKNEGHKGLYLYITCLASFCVGGPGLRKCGAINTICLHPFFG